MISQAAYSLMPLLGLPRPLCLATGTHMLTLSKGSPKSAYRLWDPLQSDSLKKGRSFSYRCS